MYSNFSSKAVYTLKSSLYILGAKGFAGGRACETSNYFLSFKF